MLNKLKSLELHFTTSRNRIIVSAIFTSLLLIGTVFSFSQFTALSAKYGVLLYILSILSVLITGALIAFKIHSIAKASHIASVVLFLLLPIVSMLMVEILNSVFIYNFEVIIFIANYLMYLMFYGIFYAITNSFRLATYIFNIIAFGLALTNNLVYSFRGTVFLPSDFLAAGTAVGVAGTYTYTLTAQILMAVILLVFILTVGSNIRSNWIVKRPKIICRTVAATFFTVIISLYMFTDVLANIGLKPDFWNQTRGYHRGGFLANFCLNVKYLYYTKPSGYNSAELNSIVKDIIDNPFSAVDETDEDELTSSESDAPEAPEKEDKPTISTPSSLIVSEKKQLISYLSGMIGADELNSKTIPNIICIMNESLADLKVLGNFETNIDYMPFIRSLKKNTIRGNLYVPVNGAGTSNSEFEFLTGCSTSFLPAGSNAYMSYIKQEIPSLVSTLEACGFSRLAFHPYYASGWNRPTVYELMGFERYRSLGSIIPSSVMNQYQASGSDPEVLISALEAEKPGNNILLRQYVSDEHNYDILISEFENRDKSKPFFTFNITMQNHGGYTKKCSNFEEKVFVTSTDKVFPKVNQYLSLVKESDAAFQRLINYFERVKEPTIICMFGDHHPSVETEFVEMLLGNNIESLSAEDMQKRYLTPFLIWANYDIEEQQIDKLSSNYLSTYVLKTAGIELPLFNKYLYSLSKVLPVIDNAGYIDYNNEYFEYGKTTKYSALLKGYEYVQYNMVFEEKNRRDELFYLDVEDTSEYENITLDEEEKNLSSADHSSSE